MEYEYREPSHDDAHVLVHVHVYAQCSVNAACAALCRWGVWGGSRPRARAAAPRAGGEKGATKIPSPQSSGSARSLGTLRIEI